MPINAKEQPAAFQVLLYYRYVEIADPVAYAESHRALCESLELRGRIIVGLEGINGTVSGPIKSTEAYMIAMHADPLTANMEFKIDSAEGHAFPKLSIKARKEIVSLGLDASEDINPNKLTGTRLTPSEWHKKMNEEDVVIIDGRNDYEAELGHFKNAICPPIRNFREFPDWLRENTPQLKGKQILTYCTGGIRCEKLSGLIRREGFEDVYQLEGGIVEYGKDPEMQGRDFDGLCYVFDERVEVEVNHTETRKIISHCRYCGSPEPRYGNCQWVECNAQIFVCPSCREEHGLYCDANCRTQAEAAALTGT
ncbi:MAG: rhodanese-related sulfurtransferase [Verrucomicrobiota bacterium]